MAIDKRILRDDYVSFDDCVQDFLLMWNNATSFNPPGTDVRVKILFESICLVLTDISLSLIFLVRFTPTP